MRRENQPEGARVSPGGLCMCKPRRPFLCELGLGLNRGLTRWSVFRVIMLAALGGWPLQDVVSLRGFIIAQSIIFFANTPFIVVQYIAQSYHSLHTPRPVLRYF